MEIAWPRLVLPALVTGEISFTDLQKVLGSPDLGTKLENSICLNCWDIEEQFKRAPVHCFGFRASW